VNLGVGVGAAVGDDDEPVVSVVLHLEQAGRYRHNKRGICRLHGRRALRSRVASRLAEVCRRRRRRVPLSPESPVPRDPPAGAETVFRDVLSGGDAHEGGALGSMALRSAVSSPLRGEIGIRLGRCDSLSRARSAPRAR
jgi:hypothetical protein